MSALVFERGSSLDSQKVSVELSTKLFNITSLEDVEWLLKKPDGSGNVSMPEHCKSHGWGLAVQLAANKH